MLSWVSGTITSSKCFFLVITVLSQLEHQQLKFEERIKIEVVLKWYFEDSLISSNAVK